MACQVFYRKWRPQTLAEVVGQEPVTQTLRNALNSGRVSHAYLFYGPRGTGKTSTGRILAKAVNCLTNGKGEPCNTCPMCQAVTEGRALDVIEIDAASNRGIDEIRELRERVNYAPNQARYKVYIIDEVHMLTKEASNALLKTLEEPPSHVIFILATTEVHKVLPTILSRCQRFDFRRISQSDMVSKLTHICNEEGIYIEPDGLRLMARSATGSLRDAENLLQQLTTYYGSEIELHQIQAILGVTGDWRVKELVKHIINNDVSAGMTTINSVNSDGLDLKQFNRELVEYLRGLLLIKTGSDEAVDFTDGDIAELKDLAVKASLPQILKVVKLFGQLELGFDNYSTLPLELALVDCVLPAEEKKRSPISEAESRQPVKTAPPPVTSTEPEPSIAKSEPTTVPEAVATPLTTVPEAATTPPTIVPEAATTPPQPGNEIEQLRLNWKRIIDEAPADIRKTRAIAFLRSANVKPVAIEDDAVILSIKYDVHKEQIEKPENLMVAEKIVSDFLRRPCRVRCIHKPEDNHLLRAALKMGAQVTSVEEK
ncbi:MAG TPA: DNA polymerase III subunit gamma/tau [Dehalococcoidia bacterium]|nr:DNA polymerase III subunit gamma/tau [Dehalococcoidia bacterium]